MKRWTVLALAMGFAASALAAPETYVIDADHTFPRFEYDHFGYSTQLSRFDKTRGTIVFDKAERTGSVDVVVDMKSVNTGSALFNDHIQAADFLDTVRYPTATFKSTRLYFEGETLSKIDGDLTIKGIRKPVSLKVTSFRNAMHPIANKDVIGANATTRIKRSDFNAGKYAPHVGDEVTLRIALEGIKQ
ncbi:MAG: YceI family protein [Rhodospirillaceae bacterium]